MKISSIHHRQTEFKNMIQRVVIILVACLVLKTYAEELRCVPVTEENEYICTDSWKNAMISWFDENGYFGVEQQVKGSKEEMARTNEVLRLMKIYLIEEVTLYNEETRERCNNYNELCAFWAAEYECDNNRVYMLKTCPLACRFCLASYILYKDRSVTVSEL